MSNTSNNKAANSKPTKSKDKDKLRVIVGEIGRDSKTGILGRGYSPDNGKTFHVTETMYGRLYNGNDIDAIWNNGTSEKVKSEVNSATAEIPAVKLSAEEAVKKADSAISLSKVNSDTLVAQSNAISEAKSSMESSVAEINQAIADANSNAAKIRADVDQVQSEVNNAKSANESTVEQIKSDISQTKDSLTAVNDKLAQAQSAANQAQSALREQVNQLSASVTANHSAITQAQTENDNVAKRLDVYASQASAQGETIKTVQSDVAGNTATIADINSNVTQVQQMADNLSASLKNADSSIASVKAQADNLSATLSNQAKSIASVTATATQIKTSLSDATGRLSTLEQTSSSQSATLSDVQKNLNNVTATATTLTNTLSNAQGIINKLQASAKSTQEQISDLQGNYTALQTTVNGLSTTVSGHDKSIESLQVTANGLTNSVKDAQGNISSLQSTAKTLNSSMTDAQGRLSRVEQTASTLTNEFSDEQGHLNRVEQKATGTEQTVANQQGQINTIKTDVNGIHETLTGQDNQIANINVTLSGLNSKYEGVSGDLGKLKDQVTTNSTQITQNQQAIALKADQSTVNNLSGEVSQAQAQLKVQADQISSKVSSTDFKTLNDKVNGMQIGGRNLVTGTAEPYTMGYGIPNTTWQNGYAYESLPTKILAYEILPQNDQFFANLVPGQEYTQTIWFETDADVKKLNAAITWFTNVGHDEQPSKIIKVGENSYKLFSTYTWPGKTDNNVRLFDIFYLQDAFDLSTGTYIKFGKLKLEEGNVSTDWTPAPEDLTTAIQKNSTAIDQTNKQISLKADQTEVNQVKGTAIKNSSRLDVMDGEIKSKVDGTAVNNILDSKGYATMSYAQTLVKQTKDQWDVNATNLKTEIKDKDGINLLTGTADFSGSWFHRDDGSWTDDNWRDTNGNRVRKRAATAWYGLGQTVYLEPGNYTFSMDMFLNLGANDSLNFYAGDAQYNGTPNIVQLIDGNNYDHSSPQGSWFRAICHFKVTKAGNVAIRPELNHDSGTVHVGSYKLEKGLIATPWTPAPSDNASVTQISNLQVSIDGIQSTVANKADKSQITQLTNVVQSKVSSKDYQTAISQLTDDINARVAKGDLITQINLEAGRALFQSKKIYMDADTVVFSGKAIIPDAAIENLSLDKLTTGHLNIPLQDKDGNSISLNNKGITVSSPGASEKASEFSHMLFNLGNGKLSLEGNLRKISSGKTEHYRLGSFQATYDYLDKIGSKVDDGGKYIQQSLGMSFVIDTLDPGETTDKNGDFFALARSQYNSSNPPYLNGVLYNTTGNRREIGLHTFDPLYIHPYGADGYIQSTWVSWSNWNNGEKMPALTQAGITWGGIGFPKNGKVTLFDSDGHAFQPYGGSNYDDYQKQYHIGG